jgi:glycolate oxidase FAD binding subunit
MSLPDPAGQPSAWLRPDRSELRDLVEHLHASSHAWLPAGLGSRLDWGPPVRQPCQVLSCARLTGILEHNPGDFTITVEAGTPLAEVQEALATQGQWLAVDSPWGGEGSIGGLVARGLAGGYRQRYLGLRDQLIGIRLLRADGVAARGGGKVVKNVAGYDLMRLFSGSWGSLGLITEVTLRTMPLPPCRRGLAVQGPLAELAAVARWLLGSSLTPERIDWWSAPLAEAGGLSRQPLLLIGLASVNRGSLEEQLACLHSRTPLASQELEPEELERLVQIPGQVAAVGGPGWLLRLGVDPDRAEVLLAAPPLAGLAVDLAAGSGLGLAWPSAAGALQPDRVGELRRLCRQLGGHLTVLVQPPGSDLTAWEDAPSRSLIETIKRRFDPKLQLAPGRLPGVARPFAQSVATL